MPTDFHDLTARLISIHSKRLALRPVCEADTWPLFEATRNPAFNRHLLWEQPRSEWEVYRRVETIVEAARKGKLAAVSAVLKSTGAWVSLFRFQPTPAEDTVEMGIWTHDRYWHGLYSLELGRMCVDAAFATGGVQRLIGVTSRDNRSSQMLMRQVGLEVERESLRGDETGGSGGAGGAGAGGAGSDAGARGGVGAEAGRSTQNGASARRSAYVAPSSNSARTANQPSA